MRKPSIFKSFNTRASLALLVLAASGCGTPPAPSPAPAAPMALEKHQVDLGGRISVDYQIERRVSAINKVSCYAFLTGTLRNDSAQTLSRRTVIDFNVFSGGKQSFRDLTSPVSDVPPGSRAMLEMVVSPTYRDGCVNYDRIDVALRKVLVN